MIDAYETSGTSPTVPCMNFEPLLNDAEAAKFLGGLHPKTVLEEKQAEMRERWKQKRADAHSTPVRSRLKELVQQRLSEVQQEIAAGVPKKPIRDPRKPRASRPVAVLEGVIPAPAKKKAKRPKRPPTPKQLAKRLERRRKQKARWAKKVRKLRAIEKRKTASAVSKAERAENERLKEERRQERYWQWRLKHHKEVVEAEKAKAFQEGYQLGLEVGRGQASSVQG